MNFLAPFLYALSSSVLAALALGFGRGGLDPLAAHLALALGCAVGGFGYWQQRRAEWKRPRLNGWEWSAVVLFALFALRAFLWVVYARGDSICVLSPNNLGDLSLHLTYIRELANGEPFWPENPILSHTSLTYPVGVDLLHALFALCGADVFRTFAWMGLIGSVCTVIALYRWGGAFTMTGFLCNGGLAGLAFFVSGHLADYNDELSWKSIPLALFVTQRGLLYAIPAGLLLLCSWRARFFSAGDEKPLPWWGELLLYASMPVFHFHTFLFLSLLLAWWFAALAPQRRAILVFVAAAIVPATFLVLQITAYFHGPSAIGWQPGWMQDEPRYLEWLRERIATPDELASTVPPWWSGNLSSPWQVTPWIARPAFWLLNFGVMPVFVGALVFGLTRSRDARARHFILPALGIFLLCCFVKFAKWEWDNTKVMVWSYLVFLPFLWQRVLSRWPFSVRVLASVALFFSGFVSLLGGLDPATNGSPIAKRSELDGLASSLRGFPPHQRFVARPNYNHPLLLLGQKVAMGYEGHVWSHGYPFAKPKQTVDAIMNGEEGWREMAAEMGCRYIFWGAQEREAYPDSLKPWETEATLVREGDWGEIYDLQQP